MLNINNFLQNRITNEAIDEDMAQRRRVIEATRKHVAMLKEEATKNLNELNDNQTDELNKMILSFTATLDDYVNKIEAENEPIKNVGLLIYRYNLLSTTLQKIKYMTLTNEEKADFAEKLDNLIPKIEELLRYADLNNFTDLEQIKKILQGFQSQSYGPVSVSPVKYTQGLYMEGREQYNEIASSIVAKHKDLIQESNKRFLTVVELGKVQELINACKSIGTKIKTNKNVNEEMMRKIDEIDEVFLQYLDTITQRKDEINNFIEQLNALDLLFDLDKFSEEDLASYNFTKKEAETIIRSFSGIKVALNELSNFKTFNQKSIYKTNTFIQSLQQLVESINDKLHKELTLTQPENEQELEQEGERMPDNFDLFGENQFDPDQPIGDPLDLLPQQAQGADDIGEAEEAIDPKGPATRSRGRPKGTTLPKVAQMELPTPRTRKEALEDFDYTVAGWNRFKKQQQAQGYEYNQVTGFTGNKGKKFVKK